MKTSVNELESPYLEGEMELVAPSKELSNDLAHEIGESPFVNLTPAGDPLGDRAAVEEELETSAAALLNEAEETEDEETEGQETESGEYERDLRDCMRPQRILSLTSVPISRMRMARIWTNSKKKQKGRSIFERTPIPIPPGRNAAKAGTLFLS